MTYYQCQRGLTLVSLLCCLSFAGVVAVVMSPLAERLHQDEQAKVNVSVAVNRVRQAAITYFTTNGVWPDQQRWADFQSRLPKLSINPYDGLRIAVYHGRPKRVSDIVWGSVRIYPIDNGRNMEVVGYGRDGHEISRVSCLPL